MAVTKPSNQIPVVMVGGVLGIGLCICFGKCFKELGICWR